MPPLPPGGVSYPPRPGWWGRVTGHRPPWDASLGASLPKSSAQPTTRPARRAAKRARLGALPRGLAYLAKLLDDPRNDGKYAAFARYVQARRPENGRAGHATAIDRALAREYADGRRGDLRRTIAHRQEVRVAAGTLAVIYQLACAADVSPRAVFEALVLIGLEAISDDLRQNDRVRTVNAVA